VTSSTGADLQLSSSSESVKLPATISTRPGQWNADFQVDAVAPFTDSSAAIIAQLGSDTVTENLEIRSNQRPLLNVPGHLFAKFGGDVQFQVSSSEAGATLSASSLPDGASFSPASGIFEWTPNASQQGTYDLVFEATAPTGGATSTHVKLVVDSGTPAIGRIVNAASHAPDAVCSPGALATVEGRWLSAGSPASEPTGASLQLAGASVRINGQAAPVLYASATRIDFQCPASAPAGTTLSVVVETAQGNTQPVETTLRDSTPGIFSVEESASGQGAVTHDRTSNLAMVRNYKYSSQPAQSGDRLVISATGIGGAMKTFVNIGGIEVSPESVSDVPGHAGVSNVYFSVPQGISFGNAMPLYLTLQLWDGTLVTSNPVTVSIEN
jgi:uncharacterized protein (TIGR03437 family)